MGIDGKVAVIAGGEGPLGRAVTRKFLANGVKTFIGWNSAEEWEEARGLIAPEYAGQVAGLKVDLTKEEQAKELMDRAREKFGSVDILLHMVGMFFTGKLVWETESSIFEKLLEVNLKSAFLCAKYAIGEMLKKGRGRVVFFPAAMAADPKPRFGPYAVSKSGLLSLAQVLREELKDTDITVNAVMFSVLDTPKTRKMPGGQPDKHVRPEAAASFLCSLCDDDCDALSGSTLKLFGRL